MIKKILSNASFDFLVDKLELEWVQNFAPSHVFDVKNLNDFLYTLKSISFGEDFIVKAILVFASCVFSIAAENRSISNSIIKKEALLKNNPFLRKKGRE